MPRYDEIGYWSEIKLDIIKEYASAYLFFASDKPVANHIAQDIFKKYADRKINKWLPTLR